jgi:hypothetical protein
MADLLTARWSVLLLGAHVGLEEEHVHGGSTLGWQWVAKSETGATRQESAEPHGQFTGIDVFIACCCLNRHVDAIKAANTPESYWFWRGGIELKAGDQE